MTVQYLIIIIIIPFQLVDSSLSRDLFPSDYSLVGDELLPIKWMAIESIANRNFSSATDIVNISIHYIFISSRKNGYFHDWLRLTGNEDSQKWMCFQWSLGVLIWELLSCGAPPFPDLPSDQLLGRLQIGERLPQPYNCPDQLSVCFTYLKATYHSWNVLRRTLLTISLNYIWAGKHIRMNNMC